MPKQGMKRPSRTHIKPKNDVPPVPEIQGKAKSGKAKAAPLMEGIGATQGKVFHAKSSVSDSSIAPSHGIVDTDLGRDNLENDLPEADIKDL